jgi:hypothetical protein
VTLIGEDPGVEAIDRASIAFQHLQKQALTLTQHTGYSIRLVVPPGTLKDGGGHRGGLGTHGTADIQQTNLHDEPTFRIRGCDAGATGPILGEDHRQFALTVMGADRPRSWLCFHVTTSCRAQVLALSQHGDMVPCLVVGGCGRKTYQHIVAHSVPSSTYNPVLGSRLRGCQPTN